MNAISNIEADDGRVPNIQFEAVIASDDVTAFLRDNLDDRILGLKQAFVLATMDRTQMVNSMRALDDAAKMNIVESAASFSEWIKQTAEIAEAVAIRSLVAIAEVADMLKPVEAEAA